MGNLYLARVLPFAGYYTGFHASELKSQLGSSTSHEQARTTFDIKTHPQDASYLHAENWLKGQQRE
tara:strand:+ start:661 stop:858 length:198 start_codon:yes stop_codon:yes gene_type:complete